MLSPTDPRKRAPSAETTAISARTEDVSTEPSGIPSTSIWPDAGEKRRSKRSTAVVLPAPEGPTSAAMEPAGTTNDSPQRTSCPDEYETVSYTHLRAHETRHDIVCRLLLEKKNKQISPIPRTSTSYHMPSSARNKKKKL